jgi:hypothetical protein
VSTSLELAGRSERPATDRLSHVMVKITQKKETRVVVRHPHVVLSSRCSVQRSGILIYETGVSKCDKIVTSCAHFRTSCVITVRAANGPERGL